MDKITSFYCPKCEQDGIRHEAKIKKDGRYLCGHCGSTYASFESAWPKK